MTEQAKGYSDPEKIMEHMQGRDIHEAARTLKDSAPEELQMYAKHDWDMIREVAAVAFAYGPRTGDERTHVDAVGTVQSKNEVAGIIFCALDPALKNGIAQQRTAIILKRLQEAGYVTVNWVMLAQALIKLERDPKGKDQAWFDFMGKAQRLLRLMAPEPDHFRSPPTP